MQTLVGIFKSRRVAEEAVGGLCAIGIPSDAIVFVTPDSREDLAAVPTTDAEAPGMGEMLSGYVGGVIGGSVGLGAGAAVASLLVPGVGTVTAIGVGAAALLGVAGAAAGAAIGDATEKALDQGVPRDAILFYRELLKRGRSLVIASAANEESVTAIQAVMHNRGAEDIDAARREFHVGPFDQAA